MGCPDWPKCFGQLVPPTDVSQLPEDYKEYYASYRQKKNERFARYLDVMGMEAKADHIRTEPSILNEADFNVVKTWTEFVNRLIGAAIGLLIMATMVYSFRLSAEDPWLVVMTVGTFILVLFQGWIGSVVVSTNLLPWTVTVHMLMALLIVVLLVAIAMRARRDRMTPVFIGKRRWMQVFAGICILATGAQIVMGTQVREALDIVAAGLSYEMRGSWISKVGDVFIAHRSFSLVLMVLTAVLVYFSFKLTSGANKLRKLAVVLIGLLVAEIVLGIILAYAGLPPVAQPAHLLLSTLMFGLFVAMYLLITNSRAQVVARAQL
jgi:cytochrome c oxidase assembly protein subunit 15